MSDRKTAEKISEFCDSQKKLGTELNAAILDLLGEKLLTVACTPFEELES
jgi:hypothetical protein